MIWLNSPGLIMLWQHILNSEVFVKLPAEVEIYTVFRYNSQSWRVMMGKKDSVKNIRGLY